MSDKTIPVFVEKDDAKIQVGWAGPAEDGSRAINLFEEFNNVSLGDVKFGDEEEFVSALNPYITQAPVRTYEESEKPFTDLDGNIVGDTEIPVEPEVPVTELESEENPLPSEPVQSAPDEELAAEPVEEAPEEPVDPGESNSSDDVPEGQSETSWEDLEVTQPYDESEEDTVVDDEEQLPEGYEPTPAADVEQSQEDNV